jgi:hypothetical protein
LHGRVHRLWKAGTEAERIFYSDTPPLPTDHDFRPLPLPM